MQWKAFKDELPQEGRRILYGNHRFVEFTVFDTKLNKIEDDLCYKPVTHWVYFELPPITDFEDK